MDRAYLTREQPPDFGYLLRCRTQLVGSVLHTPHRQNVIRVGHTHRAHTLNRQDLYAEFLPQLALDGLARGLPRFYMTAGETPAPRLGHTLSAADEQVPLPPRVMIPMTPRRTPRRGCGGPSAVRIGGVDVWSGST